MLTVRRYADIFLTVKKFLNIGSEATLKKNIRVMDDFLYKLIHGKIQHFSNSSNDSSKLKNQDLLTKITGFKCNGSEILEGYNPQFCYGWKRHNSCCSFMVSLHAMQAPKIQEKAAQETSEATQVKDNILDFEEFAATMTDETLEKMQYLHAALTETLRIYPLVPVDGKFVFRTIHCQMDSV